MRIANALVASANVILRALRKCLWPGARPSAAERVCVYRIGNIGDTACAIPALDVIRRSFPHAHITMVTSPGARGAPGAFELLQGTELLDDIVVYHAEDIASASGRLEFIRAMRARRFDLWIELPVVAASLPTLIRNMIAARSARARHGIGWRYAGPRIYAQAQSGQIDFPDEVDRLLTLLRDEGFDAGAPRFPLAISAAERNAVAQFLMGDAVARPLAVLAPGAKATPNRWPADRFAEVGRVLVARGFTVALVGAAFDYSLCEGIVSGVGAHTINLAGRTTLRESCALLGRAAILVCNDSGVQHLAAAVGTPCVSLFSCRDFRGKWWPHGAQHVVLRKTVECHTCLLDTCPRDNLCINLIEPREVVAAADEILGRAPIAVASAEGAVRGAL